MFYLTKSVVSDWTDVCPNPELLDSPDSCSFYIYLSRNSSTASQLSVATKCCKTEKGNLLSYICNSS